MNRYLSSAVFLCGLLIAGCGSVSNKQAIHYPLRDALSYAAPDGRTWVRHLLEDGPEGRYTVLFTPEKAEKGKWKELLTFGFSKQDSSVAGITKILQTVIERDDKTLTYSIEETGDGYIMVTTSPHYNDRGVMRVYRDPTGYFYVSYGHRLGAGKEELIEFWKSVFKKLPRDFPPVTPPSASRG